MNINYIGMDQNIGAQDIYKTKSSEGCPNFP